MRADEFAASRRAHHQVALVQLGGLEPPTSCSTDRRSNQLSYNCILERPRQGASNRAETRCNAALWQGRETVQTPRSCGLMQPGAAELNSGIRHRLLPTGEAPIEKN